MINRFRQNSAYESGSGPVGAKVGGPRGLIQIEVGTLRAGDAAVLLNGKKPEYFVGHVDEFNHDILLHQELIVPPGTHQEPSRGTARNSGLPRSPSQRTSV